MKHWKISLVLTCSIISSTFTSCKKESDVINSTAPVSTANPVISINQLLDSSLLVTKDLYLWYNQIPATFNAQSYADPAKLMEAIRQYSIEPGYSAPVDKWSFAIKKTDWDNQSNGIVMSNMGVNAEGNFGITVFFRAEGDLRIRTVERASPAGQAGIQRSWRIVKINGNADLTIANSDFIIDNIYNKTNVSLSLIKPDGSSISIDLSAGTYKTQPVYLDSIYSYTNKKVGYLVFNSFLGDTTQIYNEFQRIFSNFSGKNVTDVVIDLRYNGGGYVSVQEKLADLLAPSSANNGLMFKEEFNDKHTFYNLSSYFHKAGSLNLDHIYFIVSNSTASASELLINNLKPYMDVKLVGPSGTYGKPVGFFPTSVGEWYVFPVSFKSTNKNGIGGYYGGLAVNNKVSDGVDRNWGDVTESCLASVIRHITTGSFSGRPSGVATELPAEVNKSNSRFDEQLFKGAIGQTMQVR